MKIVLRDSDAAEYLRLREADRHHRELLAVLTAQHADVVQRLSHVSTLAQQLEAAMGQVADQLNARLDEVAAQVDTTKQQIISIVQSETVEDAEQNARLAAKQQELDAALTEIQRLRDELASGVSAAEAADISNRIAGLAQRVTDLSAEVRDTPSGGPTPTV